MARARFWDQFNLSATNLNETWEAAQSIDAYLDEPNFSFRGQAYEDILVLNRTDDQGTEWWFEQYGNNIVLNEDGMIVSGTVNALANWFQNLGETTAYYNIFIEGFSVDARAFTDAMTSADTVDDLLIFQEIFRRSDSIRLSDYDDDFSGWSGHDTIRGGAGNDTISGDAGRDRLMGDSGNDRLFGGAGNDVINGGRGRDILFGDGGADRFMFDSTSGRDRVADFEDGLDRIVISTGAESMADLTITDTAAGARLAFGTVTILLLGEVASAITSADIDFI